MHPRLDGAAGFGHGDGQGLDGVAQFGGVTKVLRGQAADALGVNGVVGDGAMEGEAAQYGQLVGGVDALNVVGGIRFGVAPGLGFGEGGGEGRLALRHLGQDVVGGAVDDGTDGTDVVGEQVGHQAAHDGDAAAGGGFKEQVDLLRLGQSQQGRPPPGHYFLVGGDDVLAGGQGAFQVFAGGGIAAHCLDDHLYVRVGQDVLRVGGEDAGGRGGLSGAGEVAHQDAAQVDLPPGFAGDGGGVVQEGGRHAAAHGAQPHQADVDGRSVVFHNHWGS